mgnify:CR=1 FL=1
MADSESIQKVLAALTVSIESLKNVNSAKTIEEITELALKNSKIAVYIVQAMWNRFKEVEL